MSFLGRLLSPIAKQILTYLLPMVAKMIKEGIEKWYEEWQRRKRLEADDRRMEEAMKNPDRREAARQLNDTFKGKSP